MLSLDVIVITIFSFDCINAFTYIRYLFYILSTTATYGVFGLNLTVDVFFVKSSISRRKKQIFAKIQRF